MAWPPILLTKRLWPGSLPPNNDHRRRPFCCSFVTAASSPALVSKIPAAYEPLIERFWPGPLTLIFPARPNLPALLTAGSGTVGIRMSSHPLAGKLLDAVGGPITATSANISTRTPLSAADQVMRQLAGRIDAVLDGGATAGIGSSTIISLAAGKLVVVRQGVLPFADIRKAVGR